jgi:hypothetical protein
MHTKELKNFTSYRCARTTASSKLRPAQTAREVYPIIRRVVCCVSFATLVLIGAAARAEPGRLQSDPGKQSEPVRKSIAGKVASIGSGTPFELQVDGNDKQVMNFVVGKNTEVKGRVTAGTLATVEYQPGDGGRNVAVSRTVRS